ncbi:MAG: hypothetical protein N2234_07290 [Planctomycetota bacterium]|nr:hypothetical protein [Planctomycetota bacterium]
MCKVKIVGLVAGILCVCALLAQEKDGPDEPTKDALEKAKDAIISSCKEEKADEKVKDAAVNALTALVKEGVSPEDAGDILVRAVKDKLNADGIKKLCDGVIAILKMDEKVVAKEVKTADIEMIADLAEEKVPANDALEIANLVIKNKFSAEEINKLCETLEAALEKDIDAKELAKFVKEKLNAGVKGEELLKAIGDKVNEMSKKEGDDKEGEK